MADRDLDRDGIKNSAKGKAKDLKGRIKDAAGGLTGDADLQLEGKIDQIKGKVQDAYGKAERNVARDAGKKTDRRR
jgi:uncharacterized protein YjbJ (UPF0337 family)